MTAVADDRSLSQAPAGPPLQNVSLRRLAGEDAPAWLIGGFAALGAMFAVAASVLALSAPETMAPSAQGERATPAPRVAVAPTPILPPPAEPLPLRPPPAIPPLRAPKAAAPRTESATPPREAANEAPPAPASKPAPFCLAAVSVPFAYNSARPMLDGLAAAVEPLRKWLDENPKASLMIEGHADPKGGEAYNVVLSFSRAKAVAAWLVEKGARKSQLSPRAVGVAQPKNPARLVAENRMALLQIEGVEDCPAEGGETK